MTWDWEFVQDIMPRLLVGVWYTFLVTAGSALIAIVGGLVIAILENISTRIARGIMVFWLEFFRGVPVLVLLYFGYYVLPEFGLTLPGIPLGIAVLGIVYAAFCSEVYRGSLITIPNEMRDACVALNLRRSVMWMRVLIPLMVTRSIPALVNYILSLFRLTAYLFVVGAPVLMLQANIIAEESYRYLEAYTVVGMIYMTINLPFLYLLARVKSRYASY